MKYVVFLGDGFADYPLEKLQMKTPLQVAKIPNMDFIAQEGCTGGCKTIPEGMHPGSDVAILSILGYDPKQYYSGRGPLEALSIDLTPAEDEVVFRCNLVSVSDGIMQDYSGGHISSEEARVLIDALNNEMKIEGVKFYSGVSYRNIVTIKENLLQKGKGKLNCTPPHDITGQKIKPYLPSGRGSEFLRELIGSSEEILSKKDVNLVKLDLQENPANMIWVWGGGKVAKAPSFVDRFGVQGAVITAVDLVKGVAKFIGLKVVDVPGATGYYDTDYNAKAEYALKALEEVDFVFIHLEAADEASHNEDIVAKIRAMENFDEKIVDKVLNGLKNFGDYRVLLMPDHFTPISLRTHSSEQVPFAIYGKDVLKDDAQFFNESLVEKGSFKNIIGHRLMEIFFQKMIEK